MILVSACLMGKNCKYSGVSNDNAKVHDFLQGKEYIMFCPEMLGNLPVPRQPVEIIENRAKNSAGQDKTQEFSQGATLSLQLCEKYQPELIILKESSPSCGVHKIYDGTFSHTTVKGSGFTASLLKKMGYTVISEEDL